MTSKIELPMNDPKGGIEWPARVIQLDDGTKVLEHGRIEHGGKFYFKRAFVTTFAILTAVSAFTAAWMLIWLLILGSVWGTGQDMDESPIGDPGSDFSLSCDPDTELC